MGCHVVAMHLLLCKFLYSLPFPFSLAFYTQYACMLTCNTQPLQKEISVRRGDVIYPNVCYIDIFPKNDIPFRDALPCFFGHNTWWESWERKKLLVVCANLSRVTVLNCYTIVEANHLQACQASFKIVDPHNTHSTYQRICV